MNTKILKEMQYSDEMLDIIYNRDEYTTSDLQGLVYALVMRIARDKDLLTGDGD